MSNSNKPLNYQKISTQTRLELIRLCNQEKLSATQAGRILGIKSSTAKLIIRRYKRNGTMFIKKEHPKTVQKNVLNTQNSQTCQNRQFFIPQISNCNMVQIPFNLYNQFQIQGNYGVFLLPFNPSYWF